MVVTMHTDLVPACFHFANQIRRAVRDPTENEKRRAHVVTVQQIQYARRVRAHSQIALVPVVALDCLRQIMDAEPVFQIYRQCILHAVYSRLGSQRVYLSPVKNLTNAINEARFVITKYCSNATRLNVTPTRSRIHETSAAR